MIAKGTAKITATAQDGSGVSGTCTVTVDIPEILIVYGDVDGNGSINISDAVCLKKYLAGMTGIKMDKAASDANGDGDINISDAVILLKHFAGMNVELGKGKK